MMSQKVASVCVLVHRIWFLVTIFGPLGTILKNQEKGITDANNYN